MGSATSMQDNARGAEILEVLRREAQLPQDLSDLGPDLNAQSAREEVVRLRGVLRHVMAEDHFVTHWLRPSGYHSVRIPIPSPAELRAILDSQVKKKAVLEARSQMKK